MEFWRLLIVMSALTGISLGRHVSYEELVALKADCRPYDTCNTTKENIETSLRSCECDSSCAIYGDCCIDARKRPEMERIKTRNSVCLEVDDFKGYFVVSTCKSSWKDLTIKRKCERQSSIEDPFASIPAKSQRSNITYKNRYCASCNEDAQKLQFWKIGVTCPRLNDNVNYDIRNNLTFNSRLNTWGLYLKNRTFVDCYMKPAVPDDKKNLRFCYPGIKSTCPRNWRDHFIREKCESYAGILIGEQITDIYRNVHCAICNGVNIRNYKLSCTSIFQRKLPGSPNFTHLFDVEQDNRINTVSRCGPGEVWDSAFEKCRKLSCGLPFLVLRDGVCVPK